MALSLQAIFGPLNDFFVERFSTATGSPVAFRFDKFGVELAEADFSVANQPGGGYSAAMAVETFSDLVNRVPTETADGLSVVFTMDAIDSTYYHRMLMPSIPVADALLDSTTRQAIFDAFNLVKADALKTWEHVTLESLAGVMLEFKPSLATPETWYDASKTDVWTTQTLVITDSTPATSDSPPTQPETRLWKLKANDASMAQILQLPDAAAPEVHSSNLAKRALEMRAAAAAPVIPAAPAVAVAPAVAATPLIAAAPAATPVAAARMSPGTLRRMGRVTPQLEAATDFHVSAVATSPTMVSTSSTSVALFDKYAADRKTLPFRDRIRLTQYVGDSAPTQPTEVQKLTVSFAWCLVQIRRPWYTPAFISNASWYLPGTAKGAITDAIPLMPIALIGIRDLTIEANWSSTDLQNAAVATSFGPFKIDSSVVNDTLSHPGLQIIGWLLQAMPPLPPNDPPNSPEGA